MAKCPKCGSTNVKFQLRSAGTSSRSSYYRTGVKTSWFLPAGEKSYKSRRKQISVGLCQNCGYHWEVGHGFTDTIIGVIVLIFIVSVVLALCSPSSTSDKEKTAESSGENTIWASDYTALSDFSYRIENDEIIIEEYIGGSKQVYIAPEYEADNERILPVASLESTFALHGVNSVIVSEGIREISDNAFNSCGIEYLYLPSTLEKFTGWTFFHDAKVLYFGSNESALKELCSDDISDVDFSEIVYEASIEDLVK